MVSSMAPLVTVLLMLINFAGKVSAESPYRDGFSALDLWMLGTKWSLYNTYIKF